MSPTYERSARFQSGHPGGKLWGYALNLECETGTHKARVFASALGIEREHAEDHRPKLTTAYVERSPRNKLLLAGEAR